MMQINRLSSKSIANILKKCRPLHEKKVLIQPYCHEGFVLWIMPRPFSGNALVGYHCMSILLATALWLVNYTGWCQTQWQLNLNLICLALLIRQPTKILLMNLATNFLQAFHFSSVDRNWRMTLSYNKSIQPKEGYGNKQGSSHSKEQGIHGPS